MGHLSSHLWVPGLAAAPQATFWGVAGELKAGSEVVFVAGNEPVWQACRVMSGLAPAKNNFVDKKIN